MGLRTPKSPQDAFKEAVELKQRREQNLREFYNSKKPATNSEVKSILENIDFTASNVFENQKKLDAMAESIHQNTLRNEAARRLNNLRVDGTRMTRNKVLFEMVYEGLWIDDVVKNNSVQPLYESFSNMMDLLEQVCPNVFISKNQKSTPFIEGMNEAIQCTVDQACSRIKSVFENSCKDAKTIDDAILDKLKFNLSDKEEDELDDKMKGIGKDEIVDLVKSKVIQVVQDEKERGEEKAKLFDELNDAVSDDESDSSEDEEAAKEELESFIQTNGFDGLLNDDVTLESFLMESIFNNSNQSVKPATPASVKAAFDNLGFFEGCREYLRYAVTVNRCKRKLVVIATAVVLGLISQTTIGKLITIWKMAESFVSDAENKVSEFNDAQINAAYREISSTGIKLEHTKVYAPNHLMAEIREVNNAGVTSIFEGLNVLNLAIAKNDMFKHINDGGKVNVMESEASEIVTSSAMMQTLTQYATLEMLNTIKYCKFTPDDLKKIKTRLVEESMLMHVANKNGLYDASNAFTTTDISNVLEGMEQKWFVPTKESIRIAFNKDFKDGCGEYLRYASKYGGKKTAIGICMCAANLPDDQLPKDDQQLIVRLCLQDALK